MQCRQRWRSASASPRHAMLLLVLLLVSASHIRPASSDVILVWAVTRHGARNVLPKNATLQETEANGGPTLLPQGIALSRAAGSAFRARYLAHPSCTAASTCLSAPGREGYAMVGAHGAGFSNYDTFARSSALDRTLLSAYAFLGGAFPVDNGQGPDAMPVVFPQLVPVYSTADKDDWRVRGYTKCPAYQRRLAAWFGSDAFAARERETLAFREEIGRAAPRMNTSLANWWNVYDAFNSWRRYQVGDPQPKVTDDQFNQITSLANWLETAKMNSSLTGSGLGGGLVADLLGRMDAAATATFHGDNAHYYRLLLTSAHYNTLLGIIAALKLDQHLTPAQLQWLATIPATSSVMAFELHLGVMDGTNVTSVVTGDAAGATTGDPVFAVRMVIQDGPRSRYVTVPLPCASPGEAAEKLAGPGACEMDAFIDYAETAQLGSASEWCSECDNDNMDACVASDVRGASESPNTDSGVYSSGTADAAAGPRQPQKARDGGGNGEAWKIAVAVLASVLGTAAAAAAAALLLRRRERLRQQEQEVPETQLPDVKMLSLSEMPL